MTRQAILLNANRVIQPLVPGGATPEGNRRIIFMVHGFNNDSKDAGASYVQMRRGLDALLTLHGYAEPRRRSIQQSIWEFHWPGFYAYQSCSREGRSVTEARITAALYNLQVRKARRWVADLFAQYCLRLGATEIAFVAHSLGCRVVLEVIKRLVESKIRAVHVSGALLMAGAVPAQFLLPHGRFHAAARKTGVKYCFYSRNDMVLLLAFPGGQALAGEVAPFAIGRSGWPRSAWTSGRDTHYGHSDYWKSALTFPADTSLRSVITGMFLTPLDRLLPANVLGAGRTPQPAVLPVERVPDRALPGDNWLRDLCGDAWPGD